MSKGKHTPGPWEIRQVATRDNMLVSGNWNIHQQGHNSTIASIAHWRSASTRTVSTYEANARLIAAAPQLLEALNAWRNWSDDHLETPQRLTPTDICTMIDNAIAAAEGNQ